MFTVMIAFHTLVAILLVVVVLMQSAKGEGLAGAFGGGGGGLSGAVFGGRGAASFLSRATTVLAIIFMVNCGVLAYMSSHRTGTGGVTADESAVTREAAKEMERQAQQQQMIPPQEGQGQGQLPPQEGQTDQSGFPPAPTGETQTPQTQPATTPDEGTGQ
ncbi:MAG: preprotein translocase subunit SecG [Candidatus Zixiibacteriota bacterium]|nr:MAG: preprotein translocase subunit SecG [candidate division Zixibacteria bacterium]